MPQTAASVIPIRPHTRIDNEIIDRYLSEIGPIGYAIYSVLKRHENQKTGRCNPSYKTIAKKIGVDRGTVIRHIKKLVSLCLISPKTVWDGDGDRSSNQYDITDPGDIARRQEQRSAPPEGGCTQPPPCPETAACGTHGGSGLSPEQLPSEQSNRTKNDETPAQRPPEPVPCPAASALDIPVTLAIDSGDQKDAAVPSLDLNGDNGMDTSERLTRMQQACTHSDVFHAANGEVVYCRRCYAWLADDSDARTRAA